MKNRPEYIEALVEKYRAGDRDAGYELICAFRPLMYKYEQMLHGRIDASDRYQRWFMALFVTDPEVRQKIRRKYCPKSVLAQAHKDYSTVLAMLAKYDIEDIRQDMQCAILALASRYKKLDGKTFVHYVQAAFPHAVARAVKKYIKDPSSQFGDMVRRYEDALGPPSSDGREVTLDDLNDESGLGPSWIAGETCSDVFQVLTPLERMTLRMRYYEGLTDREIALCMGSSSVWVGKVRKGAIEKLRRALADKKGVGFDEDSAGECESTS